MGASTTSLGHAEKSSVTRSAWLGAGSRSYPVSTSAASAASGVGQGGRVGPVLRGRASTVGTQRADEVGTFTVAMATVGVWHQGTIRLATDVLSPQPVGASRSARRSRAILKGADCALTPPVQGGSPRRTYVALQLQELESRCGARLTRSEGRWTRRPSRPTSSRCCSGSGSATRGGTNMP